MKSYKIINDPIYGFITVPRGLILEILDHPWMQRLRRISQLGCSHFVYPGAVHSRFHHVMGAFHLMQKALSVLENKGIEISDEERDGAYLAILLHDLGHGPFSHALEGELVPHSHEEITKLLISKLNRDFDGKLATALQIFEGQHPRLFFNQLVAGQLDMDRMDYLSRDSFYTGVAEGVISYDRITLMLNTHNDQLVLEEKGIYSLEKFLTARKLMYWQVYLHKTALSAEKMLLAIIRRLKALLKQGKNPPICPHLQKILQWSGEDPLAEDWIPTFLELDDINIMYSIKNLIHWDDRIAAELSGRFLHRRLFKIELTDQPPEKEHLEDLSQKIIEKLKLTPDELPYFLISGKESNTAYRIHRNEIIILKKDGTAVPYSDFPNPLISSGETIKHYLIYPK